MKFAEDLGMYRLGGVMTKILSVGHGIRLWAVFVGVVLATINTTLAAFWAQPARALPTPGICNAEVPTWC